MKITSAKVIVCAPSRNFVTLKIETDEGLTGIGDASVGLVLPRDIASLARLDVSLLFTTLVVAVLAAVLAALYPTFRAARVVPAWQLKSN